jgi:hypothetical protein
VWPRSRNIEDYTRQDARQAQLSASQAVPTTIEKIIAAVSALGEQMQGGGLQPYPLPPASANFTATRENERRISKEKQSLPWNLPPLNLMGAPRIASGRTGVPSLW